MTSAATLDFPAPRRSKSSRRATARPTTASDHRRARVPPEARPRGDNARRHGVIFVNDALQISGAGFLLGGDEARRVAKAERLLHTAAGGACKPIADQEIAMTPVDPFGARTRPRFRSRRRSPASSRARSPARSGRQQTDRAGSSSAAAIAVSYDMVSPQISASILQRPRSAQYVFVHGGGFVGGEAGAVTEPRAVGDVQQDRRQSGAPSR